MSSIPRVAEYTRERISREFDDLGPDACRVEISRDLAIHNPELLDMARNCARDVGDPARIMVGFCMFYRLLTAQSGAAVENPLPCVTPQVRNLVVQQIDENGERAFTEKSIDALERSNPELLQMAHDFASRHADYLGIMQGFALLYASLVAQWAADRARLN